jgi:di/tricarboxylate transporter
MGNNIYYLMKRKNEINNEIEKSKELIQKEKESDVKFKIGLIVVVIILVVWGKVAKNEISFDSFFKFEFGFFTLQRLNEVKGYLIFLIVVGVGGYLLSKSNNEWVKEEIDKFVQKEEEKNNKKKDN